MTLCRIDDADNLHVTYHNKVSGIIWKKVAVSVIVLLLGVIAYGFAAMRSDKCDIVWLVTFVIIAWLILSGYLKMKRNISYFSAYLFDERSLLMIDLTEAFGNDTLLGKSYSINSRNGVFQRMKIARNMQKIPETSHLEAFICSKDVIGFSGYTVENVFDITEDKEFLRVKMQLKGFRTFNSYSCKKTIRIPKSFTNFDALRFELEKLRSCSQ